MHMEFSGAAFWDLSTRVKIERWLEPILACYVPWRVSNTMLSLGVAPLVLQLSSYGVAWPRECKLRLVAGAGGFCQSIAGTERRARPLVGCGCYGLLSVTGQGGELDPQEEIGDEAVWENEILEEFQGIARKPTRKVKSSGESEHEDSASYEWAARAREKAIKAIQSRGLPIDALLQRDKKKKVKQHSRGNSNGKDKVKLRRGICEKKPRNLKTPDFETKNGFPILANSFSGQNLSTFGNYWKTLNGNPPEVVADRYAHGNRRSGIEVNDKEPLIHRVSDASESKNLRTNSQVPTRYQRSSQISEGTILQADYNLNRRLVQAVDADEVLRVACSQGDTELVLNSMLLSPVNASTALHRIAKHMENNCTNKFDRLAFGRKREMSWLVNVAMESLPNCSAQSISNIAWSLSKVGGISLYQAEMDLIAESLMAKLSELNPQNIANVAGAYASMQHAAPCLFNALDTRAGILHKGFQSHELSQLLWAFATLYQTAHSLLDSLDATLVKEKAGLEPPASYLKSFDFGQLSIMVWSYTVLQQLHRSTFTHLWSTVQSQFITGLDNLAGKGRDSWHLSQIYQSILSLKYEHPELNLSVDMSLEKLASAAWEKEKLATKLTSSTQREVERLLVATGRDWVVECKAADYSLDIALVEEKIGIEIDGPAHFSRNTGTPLGHTLLKQRQLAAGGWKVISISYEKWEELEGQALQMKFLRELVQEVLQARTSATYHFLP